jgi:ABC-type bacteriocin/lantibiotic exporter with double-glycine peptidase domain
MGATIGKLLCLVLFAVWLIWQAALLLHVKPGVLLLIFFGTLLFFEIFHRKNNDRGHNI